MTAARAIKQNRGHTPADPAEVFRARIEARAMLYAAGKLALDEIVPDDEYVGLSDTFAAACRAADAAATAKAEQKQNRVVKPPAFRLAESTVQAAEFLIKQNDPERLRAWLNAHSQRERAAILEHIAGKS